MDRIEAIAKIRADFQDVKDRIIRVTSLSGYTEEDSVDFVLSTPALVKVVDTSLNDLIHQVDDWMDPYWNLELVEPHPELKNARSFWMFGTSYNLKTQAVEPARFSEIAR